MRCLQLEGGACEQGINFLSYEATLMNGQLQETGNLHCELLTDSCEAAVCQVFYEFANFIVGQVDDGNLYKSWRGWQDNAVCVPHSPDLRPKKSCEGTAPNVEIKLTY